MTTRPPTAITSDADADADRLARVGLSCAGEPGHPLIATLVADHGAAEAFEILVAGGLTHRHRQLVADLAERLPRVRPREELERAAALGLRFVVPGDPEWPVALDDLAHSPALHERSGVPVGLWCRGPLRLSEVSEHAVAVVGSRSSTTYGTAIAQGISGAAAADGWTVVSGGAFGIDRAAHGGALAAGGSTIAVLACGADRVYPTAHRDLLVHLGREHLVVSEAAPGGAPTRIRFLARNRLIAALSRGTVVVEAATRSGALNTASWAAGLGRVVMAVPGPVTSEQSSGTHQLVRTRDALLVTSGDEVLEAVAPMGDLTLSLPRAVDGPRDALTGRERQVLDAVPKHAAATPESVARVAGIERGQAATILRRLQDRGLVDHASGRYRLASEL